VTTNDPRPGRRAQCQATKRIYQADTPVQQFRPLERGRGHRSAMSLPSKPIAKNWRRGSYRVAGDDINSGETLHGRQAIGGFRAIRTSILLDSARCDFGQSPRQTPNTKNQAPEKLQASSDKQNRNSACQRPANTQTRRKNRLEFGDWGFFGAWMLVFGVSLVFGVFGSRVL
jgi:hypothetical protein